MDKFTQFKEYVSIALEHFKEIDRKETIRLVSHLDADGLSACALMMKALNSDARKYSISIVQQLTSDVVESLATEPYDHFVFMDLGAGQLALIKKLFVGKQVFILDHHVPDGGRTTRNIYHVNPHRFGIDGGKEISGAGVTYLFVRGLHKKIREYAHLGIVGAVGDLQDRGGFRRLNREILEDAVKSKKITIKQSLRLFGAQTRPLHRVLEYSTDPYIPGVSGNEKNALMFLKEIGVEPKNGREFRRLINLDEGELNKLVRGIIARRAGEDRPEDVLGDIYVLTEEDNNSPYRDVKEFSTLLNACGRLEKSSLGIGAALGNKRAKADAARSLMGYRREIMDGINWYHRNKGTDRVIAGKGYVIINGEAEIRGSIVGTLASILSRGGELESGTFVMSLADLDNGYYKVSLRLSGRKDSIDLRKIVGQIVNGLNGESGGHKNAAGAMVRENDVDKFINQAKRVLGRHAIEELVH